MGLLRRLAVWGTVIFIVVYVVTTRPGVATDAVHAVARGAAATVNAAVTFLDDVLPHDAPRSGR